MKEIVQKIPFLRISMALAFGIIAGNLISIPSPLLFVFMGVNILILFILNFKYQYKYSLIFGLGIHSLFFILGFTTYSIYNSKPELYKDGYFSATIIEAPVEKENSYKSLLEINEVVKNDTICHTNEKLLVYFEKSEKAKNLRPGDVISFQRNPQLVQNNGNPFEFDYQNYLAQKKIFRQVYLPEKSWILSDNFKKTSAKILAENIRLKLLQIYRSQNLGDNELEILSALTLGYKRELDPDTKRVFASAGAMHILAVSGLHVGIVYLILVALLGFLKIRKTGKFVFVFSVLTAIWMFAFVTGLSPSVSRAATMFTFFVIGNNLKRQVNVYNSLAGSALFLLLINPNNLFEVGFQLSYSAVFGIVFLQPKFEKLVSVNNRIIRYFWQLLTVSVAAQIATFPLTAFYFNQFPTYFWLTNLIVIPAVVLLIPLGIAILIFHAVPHLGIFLSLIIDRILSWLYLILQFIEQLPFSVQRITISPIELTFLTGLVLSAFILIETRRILYLKATLIFLLLLFSTALYIKTSTLNQKQIIVYNVTDNTIVHLISGKKNYIISDYEISVTDFSNVNIENTVNNLHLAEPVFLLANQNYRDQFLLLNNGFLLFQNKSILLNPKQTPKSSEFIPEIIINPLNYKNLKNSNIHESLIVSNNRNLKKEASEEKQIHVLQSDGAFLKKW